MLEIGEVIEASLDEEDHIEDGGVCEISRLSQKSMGSYKLMWQQQAGSHSVNTYMVYWRSMWLQEVWQSSREGEMLSKIFLKFSLL